MHFHFYTEATSKKVNVLDGQYPDTNPEQSQYRFPIMVSWYANFPVTEGAFSLSFDRAHSVRKQRDCHPPALILNNSSTFSWRDVIHGMFWHLPTRKSGFASGYYENVPAKTSRADTADGTSPLLDFCPRQNGLFFTRSPTWKNVETSPADASFQTSHWREMYGREGNVSAWIIPKSDYNSYRGDNDLLRDILHTTTMSIEQTRVLQ